MTILDVDPVPKPRMTKSDRWKKRPATTRYWEFKDRVRSQIKGELEPSFSITFHIVMPKSWSKAMKSKMDGRPHQARPDIDNYLKAFMDAVCEDDSYIYDVRARKFWATEGRIIVVENVVD